MARQVDCSFRYVGCQVAYSLEVIVDLQYGNDVSEVYSDGLMQGEDLEALFFHFDFHLIHTLIGLNDPLGQRDIAFDQPLDRQVTRLLDERCHGKQILTELLKLPF